MIDWFLSCLITFDTKKRVLSSKRDIYKGRWSRFELIFPQYSNKEMSLRSQRGKKAGIFIPNQTLQTTRQWTYKFSKNYCKIHEIFYKKYIKKLKYFITWHIKPKFNQKYHTSHQVMSRNPCTQFSSNLFSSNLLSSNFFRPIHFVQSY